MHPLQAVLWQVTDATLRQVRRQFSANLEAFWDARSIYHAQLQAQQVLHKTPCMTSLCAMLHEALVPEAAVSLRLPDIVVLLIDCYQADTASLSFALL